MSSKYNKQRSKKGKSSGSGNSSVGNASPRSEVSDGAGTFTRVADESVVENLPNVESADAEPKSVYNAIINELETESPVAATPQSKPMEEAAAIPTDSCASECWYQSICGCCGARKMSLLLDFACREFLSTLTPCTSPIVPQSISVHVLTSWKSTTIEEPFNHISEESTLPVGVSEFVRRLEKDSIDSEYIISLGTSKNLCIAFPEIIAFVANHVRTSDRSVDILNAVISNQYFEPSKDIFDLLLATIVTMITDINSPSASIETVKLLPLLLSEKLGPFHSIKLRDDLIQKVFQPLIDASQHPSVVTVLEGCLLALEAIQ